MANITEILLTDIEHDKDFVRIAGEGDLQLISGLKNMKAALLRRLVTSPGALVHRPEYGVGIKDFQNAPNTLETRRSLALRIRDNFLRDSRVEEVSGVQVIFDDNSPQIVTIIARVKIIGFSEQEFSFIPFGEAVT